MPLHTPTIEDIAGQDPLAQFSVRFEKRFGSSVVAISIGYMVLMLGLNQGLFPALTNHLRTHDGVIGVLDPVNSAAIGYSALFPLLAGILFARQLIDIESLWSRLLARGILKTSSEATELDAFFDAKTQGYRSKTSSLLGPLMFLGFLIVVFTVSQLADGVKAFTEDPLWMLPFYMAVWSVGFYMVVQAVRRKIQTDNYLIQLIDSAWIRIHPEHPDRLGGLGTIGAWVAQGVRHAAVMGAALMFLTLEHLYALKSGFTIDLWLLWGLYLVLAYCFFVRLWYRLAIRLRRESSHQEDLVSAEIMNCICSKEGRAGQLPELLARYELCKKSRNPLAPLTADVGLGGVFNVWSFAVNIAAVLTPLAQFAQERGVHLRV